MDKLLLPMQAAQLAKFKADQARYMQGHPRVYRFDAKSGQFNDPTGAPLVKAGDSLKIIPLSYRIFFAELFDYTPRQWLEVFFLNASGHVCVMMFHGFSVQEFEKECAALWYIGTAGAAVNEATFEVLPEKKEKAIEDGKKFKYFIASFKVEALKGKAILKGADLLEALPPVYRRDTTRNSQMLERWLGYPEVLPHLQQLKEATNLTEAENPETAEK